MDSGHIRNIIDNNEAIMGATVSENTAGFINKLYEEYREQLTNCKQFQKNIESEFSMLKNTILGQINPQDLHISSSVAQQELTFKKPNISFIKKENAETKNTSR